MPQKNDFTRGKIRFIRGGKYPRSNSVLIDDDRRAVIDPACDEQQLLSIHRQRPLDIIINSHGHEDHILYNSRFPEALLWVPALDANVFRDLNAFIGQFFPVEEMDARTKASWFEYLTKTVGFHPREPDRLLEDKDILDFGRTRVQVLHTPGHTPGHLSFHFVNERVLFLADLDLVKFGPYYGDMASSIESTITSLKRLKTIDVDVYLVSHGMDGVMDGDPGHIERYIQTIYRREEQLMAFLASGPKRMSEIVARGIIYGGHKLAGAAWDLSLSEKAMMQKHLDRLEKSGSVVKEKGVYHLV